MSTRRHEETHSSSRPPRTPVQRSIHTLPSRQAADASYPEPSDHRRQVTTPILLSDGMPGNGLDLWTGSARGSTAPTTTAASLAGVPSINFVPDISTESSGPLIASDYASWPPYFDGVGWFPQATHLIWPLGADFQSSSAPATAASRTPLQLLGFGATLNNAAHTSQAAALTNLSTAPDSVASSVAQGLTFSQQVASCSCSRLSDDISRLQHCQLTLSGDKFHVLLEATHHAVTNVDAKLACVNCATQEPPRIRTMSFIITLEHVLACYQGLLLAAGKSSGPKCDNSSPPPFGHPGNNHDPQSHFWYPRVQAELIELERIALLVDDLAAASFDYSHSETDLRPLLATVFMTLESVRNDMGLYSMSDAS
ncbi:Hypothetical predicted protein [Lecanosticta acicola]|uniref:Uncharacterized protein n=1 Tax=Lecanosticta acicola TaxID=111012 RepID=A0AAI8Z983_9PEZI|nr:Hypothetical predicted protein [Lecanosticta acicola]